MIDNNPDEVRKRKLDYASTRGYAVRPAKPRKVDKPPAFQAPEPDQDMNFAGWAEPGPEEHACQGGCGNKEDFGLPQFEAPKSEFDQDFGTKKPEPRPMTKAEQERIWLMRSWNQGPSRS